jgi:DnaJ-class molecular chaperone
MTYARWSMAPHIYEHVKTDFQTVSFAEVRINQIETDIEQLNLEKKMWRRILKLVEANTCSACAGSGEVGYYPDGMQGGMRFMECNTCKGTGQNKNKTSSPNEDR